MNIYEEGRALAIQELAPLDRGGIGQAVTLSYIVPGAYDDNTQTVGDDQTVTIEASGVEKSIKVERVNGTSILTGDAEFVMSPVRIDGSDLALPDTLPTQAVLTLADGRKRTVVALEPKRPTGLLISVLLQLRG